MKIAVATIDGENVSQHFGRSTGFIVFEVEGQRIRSRILRPTSGALHRRSVFSSEPKPQGAPAYSILSCGGMVRTTSCTTRNPGVCTGEGKRQGDALISLEGCDVVICGGMGGGAAASVQSAGVRPVLLPGVLSAQNAVTDFLAGKGNGTAVGLCQCGHH